MPELDIFTFLIIKIIYISNIKLIIINIKLVDILIIINIELFQIIQ